MFKRDADAALARLAGNDTPDGEEERQLMSRCVCWGGHNTVGDRAGGRLGVAMGGGHALLAMTRLKGRRNDSSSAGVGWGGETGELSRE